MTTAALPFVAKTELQNDRRRYFDLVRTLATRNLQARYRGSLLGVFWSLSNPLLMTALYSAIFGSAFAAYYNNSLWDYVLACFTGLVVLNFFAQTTGQALPSIVSNGPLLNKIALPPSIFPASVVAANLFQYLFAVVPVLVLTAILKTHRVDHVLALAVPLFALLLLSIGFALATSALFVYFRDLPYLWELAVFVLFFSSPIFYPAELVPAAIRRYVELNPLAAIMTSIRALALTQNAVTLHNLVAPSLAGLASIVVGVLIYRHARPDILDLV